MSTSIEYLIAQYIPDPIRREPRNVGVFALGGRGAAAHFFAETSDGIVDGRTARFKVSIWKIYNKWVRYWRHELSLGQEGLKDRLMENNGGNYDVISGGLVTDTGVDSIRAICNNLYSMLVDTAEPAIQEGAVEEEFSSSADLQREVGAEFKKLNILGESFSEPINHPIFSGVPISGTRTTHTPAFHQQSGTHFIMEPVSFSTPQKARARDHAGWTVAMFDDILRKNRLAKPIAIVRASEEDLENSTVQTSLELLSEFPRVMWNVDAEREQFLREREAVARAA
jgi:hypothetical protein